MAIKGLESMPLLETYEAMIRVAKHELNRSGLAAFFRDTLKPTV